MVISRHPEMYGKETPPPHDLMNPGSGTINSIAVALLAVAVITLAIKEPRCDCENAIPSAETTTRERAASPRPSATGRQRELRKF